MLRTPILSPLRVIFNASLDMRYNMHGLHDGSGGYLDGKEFLGFLGGLLTTVGFIPQVWRLFKLKSAHEISLSFTSFFVIGIAFWLAYGVSFGLPPVILWNAITLVLGCGMLYAKLKYGR